MRVRIVAEHRGAYKAVDPLAPGEPAWVELSGKTFHAAQDKRSLPTVGDYVLVDNWDTANAGRGAATVLEILPRTSFLVRRAAGEATLPQPVAANVDTGIVMTSANSDISLPRLDRYIGLLRAGNIAPVIALSKIDLVADTAPILARIATIADVPVIALSATAALGLEALRVYGGPGRTVILLGSSGVGKSTLLNALADRSLRVGHIRADERGRHTTTSRELFFGPDGTAWIDTPGMRELSQWLDEDDEAAFDDIEVLARTCKFRDCTHVKEPGCAVRDGIAPERLASFHKLAQERSANVEKKRTASQIAITRAYRKLKNQRKRD